MSTLVGLPALTRLALRRDRVMLPGWIAVFVLVTATSASATARLYPNVASRTQAATAINGTPSLVALYGKVYDPASLGAVSLIKLVAFGSALVAVLAIVTVVRHTRGEEEQGRLELVGATVVGRFAALTAALVVTTGACVALGVLSAAVLFASGLPAAGSLAFGAAWAGCGIAFAAVAAVAAQLAAGARAAVGISCSVLGASYLVRAVGDSSGATGPRWLSWLSPVGWAQQVRPFAGNRWPILLLTGALAVVGIALARLLAARRDLGAGLLPDRPGPATAGPRLQSALGLAWRLQRATLHGWTVGFIVLGAVFGNIASNLSPLLNSTQGREIVRRLGGQQNLTNAFLAAELSIVGLIASAYGVHAVLRLHGEELDGRAELLLAGTLSRTRWMSSHVALAFL
jgi:ABC-2 type transport system permease protein